MNLNPMGINGPAKTANYVAPNSPESNANVNPTVNANVASYSVGGDEQKIGNGARAVFTQPADPQPPPGWVGQTNTVSNQRFPSILLPKASNDE